MISTFGPRAQRYAVGLGDVDAIFVDPQHIGQGYLEAVRRRSNGESFYGMLFLDETRDRTMTQLAPSMLLESGGPDQHRAILNGISSGRVVINGKPASELLAEPDLNDPHLRVAAAEFLALCPAVLVRSSAEYQRLSALTSRRRPFELIVLEASLPVIERRIPERPGIVIWAPERDVHGAALTAFALSEIHGDVTLVSADGVAPPGSTVKAAYGAGDARIADALATAGVIVVVDAVDPGAAIAFARAGYGIVAPFSSGAHEFVRDVCSYDPAAPRQVHLAAMMALTQPASVRELPPPPPQAPVLPALPAAVTAAPPPATIVVPTFNRRDDLERCLQCLSAQTYPNVKAVIVNDAGESVDDIVARYSFARLLNLEKNAGTVQALSYGAELVTDGFIQFLADDDWLYPDHVARLVTAMVRSGAAVAHANTLIRYVQRTEEGAFVTTGYNAAVFIETATPSEAMISTPIAGHALMWRASVFAEIGGWRPDCFLADQEFQMRAGQRYAFAYIDQITAEWRIHGENFSAKVNAATEQRRIYEELHPVPDRPLLTHMRDQVLVNIAARPPGYVFPPTLSVHSAKPPGSA